MDKGLWVSTKDDTNNTGRDVYIVVTNMDSGTGQSWVPILPLPLVSSVSLGKVSGLSG